MAREEDVDEGCHIVDRYPAIAIDIGTDETDAALVSSQQVVDQIGDIVNAQDTVVVHVT